MAWVGLYFRIRERVRTGDTPAWVVRHPRRKRLERLALSCMPWGSNKAEVCRIYRRANRLGLTVDHIIPLSHPYVCGLTVAGNLRLIPEAANKARGNNWHPDQVEAFDPEPEPYQFGLDLVLRSPAGGSADLVLRRPSTYGKVAV